MTHILVTGGAGYIGSHACKALGQSGYVPVTYDNLGRGHRSAVRWGPLVEGELTDAARLARALDDWRPRAVMHFAGYAYVGESVTDPGLYYANNVAATLTLLGAMRNARVNHIVFSSSCSVYGAGHDRPIAESAPMSPVSPYGFTKLAIERMLADYGVAYGLRSVCLRYFNAAGADPDGEIGEAHAPETHLIPLLLRAAAGTAPALTLYGDDYPTPDGTCVRDFIHVTDLANAHVIALDWMLRECRSATFNVGTGQGHSLRQVLDVAEGVTGCAIPHMIGARRAGDPAYAVGDVRLIRATLGWEPHRSTLEDIVATAWRWERRAP